MDKIVLISDKRTVFGRKVKTLRSSGKVPAVVFGKKVESVPVTVDLKAFEAVEKKAGESTLIELQVEGAKGAGEKRMVLISNIQRHPVTGVVLHVDFHQVDLKEKVTAKVQVEVTGESPAEKQSLGTAVTYISELEVEALPTDLPDKFVVDISSLAEVDQSIMVKDLKYDKAKVEVKAEPEAIVVKVEPPQKEEVAPVAPVAAEAVGPEGAVKEGEAPAEGDTSKVEDKGQKEDQK